jgi:hypothetical protein
MLYNPVYSLVYSNKKSQVSSPASGNEKW